MNDTGINDSGKKSIVENLETIDNTVYEVSKELSVSNIMQLIDLNGTKVNFQSEFIFQTVDPSKKISICVVNQDDLDNGNINFEETERGKYSRRITYQNDRHINHYIAVKKHPDDNDDKNVDCLLVIHMKELPKPLPSPKDINMNPNISDDTKNIIKNQLYQLRDDSVYNSMNDRNNNTNNINNMNDINTTNELNDINNNMNYDNSINNINNIRKESSSFINSYFFIGILFLFIFLYVFYIKKIKK